MDKIVVQDGPMTIKEVSEALSVSRSQIEKTVRELFPDKMRNGFTTYLSESEATEIKKHIQTNPYLGQLSEVTTETEISEMTVKVLEYHMSKIQRLTAENKELKGDIKQLVHDFQKTYTATEVAKELNLPSAQALNKILESQHVQFNSNGTWVLYSDYADKGYTSIKETILENGKIIYDRRWTGAGRQFVIGVVSKAHIARQHNTNGGTICSHYSPNTITGTGITQEITQRSNSIRTQKHDTRIS